MKTRDLQEKTLKDIIKKIDPYTDLLLGKSNELLEKYQTIKVEIENYIKNEKDVYIREILIQIKQAELQDLQKKQKEKRSKKIEESLLLESYAKILSNIHELIDKRTQDLLRKKEEIKKRDILFNDFILKRDDINKNSFSDTILKCKKNDINQKSFISSSKIINENNFSIDFLVKKYYYCIQKVIDAHFYGKEKELIIYIPQTVLSSSYLYVKPVISKESSLSKITNTFLELRNNKKKKFNQVEIQNLVFDDLNYLIIKQDEFKTKAIIGNHWKMELIVQTLDNINLSNHCDNGFIKYETIEYINRNLDALTLKDTNSTEISEKTIEKNHELLTLYSKPSAKKKAHLNEIITNDPPQPIENIDNFYSNTNFMSNYEKNNQKLYNKEKDTNYYSNSMLYNKKLDLKIENKINENPQNDNLILSNFNDDLNTFSYKSKMLKVVESITNFESNVFQNYNLINNNIVYLDEIKKNVDHFFPNYASNNILSSPPNINDKDENKFYTSNNFINSIKPPFRNDDNLGIYQKTTINKPNQSKIELKKEASNHDNDQIEFKSTHHQEILYYSNNVNDNKSFSNNQKLINSVNINMPIKSKKTLIYEINNKNHSQNLGNNNEGHENINYNDINIHNLEDNHNHLSKEIYYHRHINVKKIESSNKIGKNENLLDTEKTYYSNIKNNINEINPSKSNINSCINLYDNKSNMCIDEKNSHFSNFCENFMTCNIIKINSNNFNKGVNGRNENDYRIKEKFENSCEEFVNPYYHSRKIDSIEDNYKSNYKKKLKNNDYETVFGKKERTEINFSNKNLKIQKFGYHSSNKFIEQNYYEEDQSLYSSCELKNDKNINNTLNDKIGNNTSPLIGSKKIDNMDLTKDYKCNEIQPSQNDISDNFNNNLIIDHVKNKLSYLNKNDNKNYKLEHNSHEEIKLDINIHKKDNIDINKLNNFNEFENESNNKIEINKSYKNISEEIIYQSNDLNNNQKYFAFEDNYTNNQLILNNINNENNHCLNYKDNYSNNGVKINKISDFEDLRNSIQQNLSNNKNLKHTNIFNLGENSKLDYKTLNCLNPSNIDLTYLKNEKEVADNSSNKYVIEEKLGNKFNNYSNDNENSKYSKIINNHKSYKSENILYHNNIPELEENLKFKYQYGTDINNSKIKRYLSAYKSMPNNIINKNILSLYKINSNLFMGRPDQKSNKHQLTSLDKIEMKNYKEMIDRIEQNQNRTKISISTDSLSLSKINTLINLVSISKLEINEKQMTYSESISLDKFINNSKTLFYNELFILPGEKNNNHINIIRKQFNKVNFSRLINDKDSHFNLKDFKINIIGNISKFENVNRENKIENAEKGKKILNLFNGKNSDSKKSSKNNSFTIDNENVNFTLNKSLKEREDSHRLNYSSKRLSKKSVGSKLNKSDELTLHNLLNNDSMHNETFNSIKKGSMIPILIENKESLLKKKKNEKVINDKIIIVIEDPITDKSRQDTAEKDRSKDKVVHLTVKFVRGSKHSPDRLPTNKSNSKHNKSISISQDSSKQSINDSIINDNPIKQDTTALINNKTIPSKKQSDFQLISISFSSEEDEVINDDLLSKYKLEEMKIKEMAEDAIRKEKHLKEVAKSIQALLQIDN